MAARVSQVPETTAELVELTNYINESRDATMFNLKTKLIATAEYVMFLLSHALLQSESQKKKRVPLYFLKDFIKW